MKLERAYSLLEIKAATEDGEARLITGIASTPTPDRTGDIVDPKGADVKLPIPLLWQHRQDQPLGHVTAAKVTDKGIEIQARLTKVDEPGRLKSRLDEAWQSIKAGLVKGLSIGFIPTEAAPIANSFARHIKKWNWLELSAVTIPANGEANITTIKAIDTEALAASGITAPRTVRLLSGVSEKPKLKATDMKPISETIADLEATRAAKAAALENCLKNSRETGETMTPEETKSFEDLEADIVLLDDNLKKYRTVERLNGQAAKPVVAKTVETGSTARTVQVNHSISVKAPEKVHPAISMVRVMRCLAMAQGNRWAAMDVAEKMFGDRNPEVALTLKATVAAGSTLSGNWAENLIGDETSTVALFLDYLRPQTIVGKFGQGGIPDFTRIGFRTPYVTQTSGGAGYWVGEGKAKPLTSFGFQRDTLEPLKVANICVLTDEQIRDSSPNSENIVRRNLVSALVERIDQDFINPDKAASAGVSPAGILNGVTPIASSGGDIDAVKADFKALVAVYIAANNPLSSGVWVMSANTAMSLALMENPLGQMYFPNISKNGGTFYGMPVITSEYVTPNTSGDFVALINASEILFGDEGGFRVDMSREASLEMSDTPSHNSTTPTGSNSLVSMWQTNSVAFLAERTLNWTKARAEAAQWISGVQWGASS